MSENSEKNIQNPIDSSKNDPVKRFGKMALSLCLLLFIWHLFADRLTPSTDNARVRGYVVPVTPEVGGDLIEVHSNFSDLVEQGQLLATIDQEPYIIALNKAEADLELAGQEIGANTEAVSEAEAKLAQTKAQLKFVQQQAIRYRELAKKGVISRSQLDQTNAELSKANSSVIAAKANLEKAKEQLGSDGQNNPRIRAALAALKQARLDMENTHITAPTEGLVTNVSIEIGQYAQVGQPLLTLISQKGVWVEAYLRENNLGNIEVGNRAEVALDMAPGKIFSAEVAAITYGVQWQQGAGGSGVLPTVPNSGGWMRNSQRFPVLIQFTDNNSKGYRMEGGQADVTIYTGNNYLLNGLGWLGIRFKTYMSYLY